MTVRGEPDLNGEDVLDPPIGTTSGPVRFRSPLHTTKQSSRRKCDHRNERKTDRKTFEMSGRDSGS